MTPEQLAAVRAEISQNYVAIRKLSQSGPQSTETSAAVLAATQRQAKLTALISEHLDTVVMPEWAELQAERVTRLEALQNSPLNELDDECALFAKFTKRLMTKYQEIRQLNRDAGRGQVQSLTHYVAGGYLRADEATDPAEVRKAVLGYGKSDGYHQGQRTTYGGRASV